MRTKTLLLTAALSAVGVASAMAQTAVYSVNIVGYINKTIPHGPSTLANQLNATPNNTVANLLGTPPSAVTVFKFNHLTGNYEQAFYDPDLPGWNNLTLSLSPGEGAFVDNSGTDFQLTLVGEVQLNSTVDIHPGFDAYSSVIPRSGPLDAANMNFPTPTEAITVFRFNGTGYDQSFYDPDSGGWQTAGGLPPSVNIAEAFYIDNGTTQNTTYHWTVNFPVGP